MMTDKREDPGEINEGVNKKEWNSNPKNEFSLPRCFYYFYLDLFCRQLLCWLMLFPINSKFY